MKKLLTTIFILFFAFDSNGQYQTNQLMKYVIKTNSIKTYNNVIVAELDSSIVEFTLRNLKTNKSVFKSIDTSKAKITLTLKEKKFILNSLKEQYKKDWSEEDFHNLKVIKQEQVKSHTKEDKLNGYIYISSPVFIRDGKIALVFFANFYGDLQKTGGGINNLSFYKIQENGEWKKWIVLESGIYN